MDVYTERREPFIDPRQQTRPWTVSTVTRDSHDDHVVAVRIERFTFEDEAQRFADTGQPAANPNDSHPFDGNTGEAA